MTFTWEGGTHEDGTYAYLRCHLNNSILVMAKDWGCGRSPLVINQVGYVQVNAHPVTKYGSFHANLYSSVSDAMPRSFRTLEEAKQYVEDNATTGLVLKKLHIDV
jgi:hypothetical protein